MSARTTPILSLLLFAMAGCATTPEHPPYQLAHPNGWLYEHLEWQNENAASWRLTAPYDLKVPRGAALKAETYFFAAKQGFSLDRFYQASVDAEVERCSGAQSKILKQSEGYYLYESTAPFESECWGYQLVRLQQKQQVPYALIVYAHRPPSEEDRETWRRIVSEAIFDP